MFAGWRWVAVHDRYKAGFPDGQGEITGKRKGERAGEALKDRQTFNKQSWHSRQKKQYIKRHTG